MLFQELIEQHRVDRLVADGLEFAVVVAFHQVGIHFFYLLSHQPELGMRLGSNSSFVAKGNRFQGEDYFARLVHRLDLLLETRC